LKKTEDVSMSSRKGWTRQQLLVAFSLYCQLPFGKLHSRNPEIIKYAELLGRTPSALAMKLTNIASLDPEITSSGRKGLVGASLADKKMWEEMQSNWESFIIDSESALKAISPKDQEDIELTLKESPEEEADYTGSNKIIQSKVRVGQNFFRKSVLSAYNNRCCITGLAIPRLLVASHIVPWRDDEENRLNPRNGLSLSVLHDKAFDLGIITINEDMTVRVSQRELVSAGSFFKDTLQNFNGKPIAMPEKFQPRADFIAYHRENIFEK